MRLIHGDRFNYDVSCIAICVDADAGLDNTPCHKQLIMKSRSCWGYLLPEVVRCLLQYSYITRAEIRAWNMRSCLNGIGRKRKLVDNTPRRHAKVSSAFSGMT